MDYRQQLLALVSAYCVATGRSEARVSTLVLNNGIFFERLKAGKGCTVDNLLRVKRWFDLNWPKGVAWPEGVDPPEQLPRWSDNISEDAA